MTVCILALATQARAEDAGFRVEGHAFNLQTGVPLVGAQIDVFEINPLAYLPEGPTATAFSDANGFYSVRVSGLPASRFSLEAQCTGKRAVGVSSSELGSPSSFSSSLLRRDLYLAVTRARVRVLCSEGGEILPRGRFTTDPLPTQDGIRIEGHAFNTLTGTPLSGALIEVFDRLGPITRVFPPRPPRPIATVLSDSNGFYSVLLRSGSGFFQLSARCTGTRNVAAGGSYHPLARGEVNRRDLYLDVTRSPEQVACAEGADLSPRSR